MAVRGARFPSEPGNEIKWNETPGYVRESNVLEISRK